MDYINFDLRIRSNVDGHYPVEAESEAMGEAKAVLSLAPDADRLVAVRAKLEDGTADESEIKSLGGWLFGSLLKDDVRDLYRASLGQVQGDEKGLRIQLCVEPPELAAVPWELAYDARRDAFLATCVDTPLVRYVDLIKAIKPARARPPFRALLLTPDAASADAARQRQAAAKTLDALDDAVMVDTVEGPVTRARLSRALVERQYHILHFIGPGVLEAGAADAAKGDSPSPEDGTAVAALVLDAETGGRDALSAAALSGFLRDHPSLRLVILTSGPGSPTAGAAALARVAAELVRKGLPAAIAMQLPLAEGPAALFAREFYLRLCSGWDRGRVDAAVAHARNRLKLDYPKTAAFASPVLFTRSRTGILFDRDAAEPQGQAAERAVSGLRVEVPPAPPPEPAAPVSSRPAVPIPEPGVDAGRAAARRRERRPVHRDLATFALTTGLVLLASWMGVLSALTVDDWLESRFLAHLEPFVARPVTRDVVLLWASDKPEENGPLGKLSLEWRRYHAEMLDALADAGARVVVFDVRFEDSSPWDRQLADAIRRASAMGTAVVVGATDFDVVDSTPRPRLAPELAAVPELRWGTLEGAAASRRLQIARPLPGHLPEWLQAEAIPVLPSLALRTAMEFQRGPSPGDALHAVLRPAHDAVVLRTRDGRAVRSMPVVDPRLNVLVNVARGSELEMHPYHQVHAARTSAALQRYWGKIVLIGYRTPDEVAWTVSPSETRWEMEVQASAIAQILQGATIRRLRPAEQYLVILLMGGLGWLLRTRLSDWMRPTLSIALPKPFNKPLEIPVAFLVALLAYFLAAFTVFKQGGIVLNVPYDVAALLLTYGAIGWARRTPAAAPAVRPAPQL